MVITGFAGTHILIGSSISSIITGCNEFEGIRLLRIIIIIVIIGFAGTHIILKSNIEITARVIQFNHGRQ